LRHHIRHILRRCGVTPPAYYRGDGVNLLDAFQDKAVARTRPIF
jgi:hypothetical protein